MIKNKLITARKEKNMTQNDMAELLFLSQSQYQRRERGEIRISDDEWVRMAKILDKEIEDIQEKDHIASMYNYDNHSGTYSVNFYIIPEFIMKNQQEYIEMLKEKIKWLQEEISCVNEKTTETNIQSS